MLRSDPAPPLADGKKRRTAGPEVIKAIDQVHYLIPGSVHDSHVRDGSRPGPGLRPEPQPESCLYIRDWPHHFVAKRARRL